MAMAVVFPRASAPQIQGSSGIWVDVTPGGIDLNPASFGGDNYGVTDVLADPTTPSVLYAFVSHQGVWWSQNYGLTWTKRSTDGVLDVLVPWGAEICAAYMLACGNTNTQKVYKSTNGGQTWTGSATLGDDPYSIDIDRSDPTHAICSFHGNNKLYESADSGDTWTDRGAITGHVLSGYVHFVSSTVILAVGQEGDGTEGTRRGVWGGSSWSWSKVSDREHRHGSHQIYRDTVNAFIFHPNATNIEKSTDAGQTWSQVSTIHSNACTATASTLYAGTSFPAPTYAPKQQHAARPAGTSWVDDEGSTPAGMVNGPKRLAVQTDGARWVVCSGHWNTGIWRYIE
jgi:hypothetical protein